MSENAHRRSFPVNIWVLVLTNTTLISAVGWRVFVQGTEILTLLNMTLLVGAFVSIYIVYEVLDRV